MMGNICDEKRIDELIRWVELDMLDNNDVTDIIACLRELKIRRQNDTSRGKEGENDRPHGEWIFSGVEHTSDNPIDSDSYYCSVCKRSISTTLTRPEDLFPFCHCGADMRKEGDEYEM